MELYPVAPQAALAQTAALLAQCNGLTAPYGLALAPEELAMLLQRRVEALTETGRVEFGPGILWALIETFRDSPQLHPATYAQTLGDLQELFYQFKNESRDRLDDETLLKAMRRAFDGPAGGDPQGLVALGLAALLHPASTQEEEPWYDQ